MKFAELKTKEIVSVADGKKLGFAEDLVIDESNNTVVALRVPKQTRGFRKAEFIEIAFSDIVKIGENVILVNTMKTFENAELIVNETKTGFLYTPKIFKRFDKDKRN